MTHRNFANSEPVSKTSTFQKAAGYAIADRMESMALEVRGLTSPQAGILASQETLSALAYTLQQTRRRIDELFELEGFAVSPACDIVLELFHARVRGAPIAMAALCQALSCSPSVVRRWVYALQTMQLVEAFGEPGADGEKVSLTEKGFMKTGQALQLHL